MLKAQRKVMFIFITLLVILAAGCSNTESTPKNTGKKTVDVQGKFAIVNAQSFNISRFYGIGYPGNDSALYVATNKGLKMYKDHSWLETTVNNHRYFGFQAIKDGFIASGQPQKGTDLKDPLGIIESKNQGQSLEKLALYGKINFVFMAASYEGNGIYVISDQSKNGLRPGVNYSLDKGKTWNQCEFNGFSADSMGMLAVHPEKANVIAMATRSGIYYSTDNGHTMKLITDPNMVTALTFTGDTILFSSVENNKIMLKLMNPATGKQAELNFPSLDYENPITYLAVNPQNHNQIAFTTYKNDLYASNDGGINWEMLIKGGKKEEPK
ncbi:F510_1955 family glycosylhydrolase [Neobacillus sp. LXY-1]|uniref:F510_1955 family glycosylhydrolase n=1 Tax=Neobacillus sp. LXY-1 TaxID=3379133 RepID=UPI003EDF9A56